MTLDEIRNNSEALDRMGEIINDPIFQAVMSAVKFEVEKHDVAPDSDAIASVRQLSREKGAGEALSLIALASVPLPPTERERVPTFGTGLSEEDAAAAMTPEN